jgi:hypothetical protein
MVGLSLMSNPNDATLKRSLETRLALQISLSSLPVVKEWMDTEIDRWLESIPLPPELPAGQRADFLVTVASDLSRLMWSATGHPAGFIPKMSKYFDACKVGADDIALINKVGGTFEPKSVGTWISVEGDAVGTGWQFRNVFDLAAIQALFGDHEAKTRLSAWAAAHGVERFRRFAQGVGDQAFTEIEVIVPGEGIDAQIEVATAGFRDLFGEELPEHARHALRASRPELGLAVRIRRGQVVRVAAVAAGPGLDVVAQLCTEAGLAYESRVSQLQGALSAELAAFDYVHTDGGARVDLHLAVGAAGDLRKPGMN